MSEPRTISHHFLRRRARARRTNLMRDQRIVSTASTRDARALAAERLTHAHIGTAATLTVERTKRGPFRWRVVAR